MTDDGRTLSARATARPIALLAAPSTARSVTQTCSVSPSHSVLVREAPGCARTEIRIIGSQRCDQAAASTSTVHHVAPASALPAIST